MLKVSPWKGVVRFGKRGKMNPRYVGPFKVIERVGEVAYKLELPEELSRVHNTFHVSNLKKCLANEPCRLLDCGFHLDDKLLFVEEPIRNSGVKSNWEREDQFKKKYPHLFTKTTPSSSAASLHLINSRGALFVIHLALLTQDSVMSDSDESGVTHTEISSPYEDLSDIGSPRADDHEFPEPHYMLEDPYAEAALHAPPSPDYVPGPEEPEQAPPSPDYVPDSVISDSDESGVTHTEVSSLFKDLSVLASIY
ncbi:hypothetical protein Tco_0601348 [Tanacetum coccineum]